MYENLSTLWAEGTFLSSQQFQQQARWERSAMTALRSFVFAIRGGSQSAL